MILTKAMKKNKLKMYPPRLLSKKMVWILKSSETKIFFFPQLCLLDPDQQLGIHSFLTPKGMGKKGRAKGREKSLIRIKCLMSERKRDEQKKKSCKAIITSYKQAGAQPVSKQLLPWKS